jgi:hypothetical protein
MFSNNEFSIIEIDWYLRERTVPNCCLAIIIKFNYKINDKNFTENNKSHLWKVKKIKNTKETILYIPFLQMSVK